MCSWRYIPHIILRTAFVAAWQRRRSSEKKSEIDGLAVNCGHEGEDKRARRRKGREFRANVGGDERADSYHSRWCTLQSHLRALASPNKCAGEQGGTRCSEAVQTSVIKLSSPNQLPKLGL